MSRRGGSEEAGDRRAHVNPVGGATGVRYTRRSADGISTNPPYLIWTARSSYSDGPKRMNDLFRVFRAFRGWGFGDSTAHGNE